MKKIVLLIGLFIAINLNAQTKQNIKTYTDFESFQKEVLEVAQTQPTFINFWATWCAPCVEEMPLFIEMMNSKEYADVQFVFVSIDFKPQIETKLRDFVTKNKIFANTVVLLAPKPNNWINKVSEKWTGALPFTMVINNGKRAEHNGKFNNKQEVEEFIKKTK